MFASNPLALAFTGLIAVVYVTGAFELQRYGQATQTLDKALDGLSQTPPSLSQWIATIDPALQDAVRARVEGERVGLPGPALTPYLVGLLVLLGMLGTFLGMVATLRGELAPVHEPSMEPDVDAYVPWEYAAGFLDGLSAR